MKINTNNWSYDQWHPSLLSKGQKNWRIERRKELDYLDECKR